MPVKSRLDGHDVRYSPKRKGDLGLITGLGAEVLGRVLLFAAAQ